MGQQQSSPGQSAAPPGQSEAPPWVRCPPSRDCPEGAKLAGGAWERELRLVALSEKSRFLTSTIQIDLTSFLCPAKLCRANFHHPRNDLIMNPSAQPEKAKKRRSTSIPLVLGVIILGGLAYYFDAGLHVMTYVMFLQEKSKATSEVNKARAIDLVSKEKFEASQKALFKTKDVNGDGKLQGDEITDQLAEKDKDLDASISLDEFLAAPPSQGGLGKLPDDAPPTDAPPTEVKE